MRAMRTRMWAAFALAVCVAAAACDSPDGNTCFSPADGPGDVKCSGFAGGLVCPVGYGSFVNCTCTEQGNEKNWVCAPSDTAPPDTGGTGGTGGMGGAPGSGGSMPDASAD